MKERTNNFPEFLQDLVESRMVTKTVRLDAGAIDDHSIVSCQLRKSEKAIEYFITL